LLKLFLGSSRLCFAPGRTKFLADVQIIHRAVQSLCKVDCDLAGGWNAKLTGNPLHNLLPIVREMCARGQPPQQCTFVPDGEGQFTSDHGWDLAADGERLRLVRRIDGFADREALDSARGQAGCDVALGGAARYRPGRSARSWARCSSAGLATGGSGFHGIHVVLVGS
jgi:hypothetical protein